MVLLLLIILTIVLLVRARSRQRLGVAWRQEVEPVVAQATMVRDRLMSGQATDPAGRAATGQQLESVTSSLNRIAGDAPDEEATAAANAVAENLRALSFAQEAAGLLRSGTVPPTGEQLAQADQTSRTQLARLDASIAQLRAQAGSPGGPPRR